MNKNSNPKPFGARAAANRLRKGQEIVEMQLDGNRGPLYKMHKSGAIWRKAENARSKFAKDSDQFVTLQKGGKFIEA